MRIVPNPNRSGIAELFTAHRHRIINLVEYGQTDKWYGEGVMIHVEESANHEDRGLVIADRELEMRHVCYSDRLETNLGTTVKGKQ